MSTTRRLLFGFVSSLLLACGLGRAAERLDPLATHRNSQLTTILTVAQDCSTDNGGGAVWPPM